jgi:hypothetical protein
MKRAGIKRVLLGFDAARAFNGTDLTSPTLAGRAGALPDTEPDAHPVTELRVHGVAGSDGPTMLEHPTALQVAGDTVTGFYRRWSPDGRGRPSVPWKLEAYSWGGLTEAPLSSAAWVLLSPFMFFNVAHFMLPPYRNGDLDPAAGTRGAAHRIARALLRLLGLSATVQFTAAVVIFLTSTVAWQATGISGAIPTWFDFYGRLPTGWRMTVALFVVALVIGVLWLLSLRTAHRYEAKTSSIYAETQTPEDSSIAREHGWALSRPGFWAGDALVGRQRNLHVAAAAAAAALLVALPTTGTVLGGVQLGLAAAVLLASAVFLLLPAQDWEEASRRDAATGRWLSPWCRGVAGAGLVSLLFTAFAAPAGYPRPRPGALPGATGFFSRLLMVQGGLLVLFGAAVLVLALAARAARPADVDPQAQRPYFFGLSALLLAGLGVATGGVLTAVLNVGLARLMGTPVPTGFTEDVAAQLVLPKECYALVAAAWGMLVGLLAATGVLVVQYRRYRAAALASPRLRRAYPAVDEPDHSTDRTRIASAWAVGLLVDNAAVLLALLLGGAVLGFAGAEIGLAGYGNAADPALLRSPWAALVGVASLCGWLLAVGLLLALRSDYSKSSTRRGIGAIWDVATFWPRAAHPLAPPCYGERAVPELIDRVRLLTGNVSAEDPDWLRSRTVPAATTPTDVSVPTGPLLLTGYSQGTIIVTAVLAQLNATVRDSVALMTMGCPTRRLYGRAFPAYFADGQRTLRQQLAPSPWSNLVRATDYIGSWVECDPLSDRHAELTDPVDQVCLDPAGLTFNGDPTPQPIHRHTDFWPDPRTREVGAAAVRDLTDRR